ncbi:MAG: helix-turn-helix domain-containing protein [Filimonas sp.]|nr:helix-turn-helix domain-containing protein [Filimonas sp.]
MNANRNTLFELAESYVNHTNRHIFLTGRAGTGKTTFLKKIQSSTQKNAVVVAPTGVAAINAGGVTIHSFFQLPFGPFIPGTKRGFESNSEVTDQHSLFKNIRFNSNKRKLLQELELLVIDEVSMVRADMLDAVDLILRHFRKRMYEPFGGVQVLYIGDLFQLPPVVADDEWSILGRYYKSPFFFDAQVMQVTQPLVIELKKIYRQSDDVFIDLLNNVRNSTVTDDDLRLLQQYYKPGFKAKREDNYILLSTHNYKADEINTKALAELPGRQFQYTAEITGDFNEKAAPAEKDLYLKEGAQIMFIKNDKGEIRRYYNGKIGQISRIAENDIYITFPGSDDEFKIEKEEWKNVRYKYNEAEEKIEEEELGSFKQYPVRLAWAITIHKSQGLTFERAIVDAGKAFAAGQVYVALSRLTSLNGLVLHSPINSDAISTDDRVLEFYDQQLPEETLSAELQGHQYKYLSDKISHLFSFSALVADVRKHHADYRERELEDKTTAVEWSLAFVNKCIKLNETAESFQKQLQQLAASANGDYSKLQERVAAAVNYFSAQITDEILPLYTAHYNEYKIKRSVRSYLKSLTELKALFEGKKRDLLQANAIAKGLAEKASTADILIQAAQARHPHISINSTDDIPVEKPVKEKSSAISLQLYQEGKAIDEIAELRSLAKGTVETHLMQYIKTGEVKVDLFVSKEKMERIIDMIASSEDKTFSAIRNKLGDTYSFAEIRAASYFMEI